MNCQCNASKNCIRQKVPATQLNGLAQVCRPAPIAANSKEKQMSESEIETDRISAAKASSWTSDSIRGSRLLEIAPRPARHIVGTPGIRSILPKRFDPFTIPTTESSYDGCNDSSSLGKGSVRLLESGPCHYLLISLLNAPETTVEAVLSWAQSSRRKSKLPWLARNGKHWIQASSRVRLHRVQATLDWKLTSVAHQSNWQVHQ